MKSKMGNLKSQIALALLLLASCAFAANELQLNTTFIYTKGGVAFQDVQNLNITVSGVPVLSGIFPTSTNDAILSFGAVTNAGESVLVNGDTNSWSKIYYGAQTNGGYDHVLEGGRVAIFNFNTNALHYKALTGTPPLKVIILSK